MFTEATNQGLKAMEVPGTKAVISNLEGFILEISLE